MATATIPLTIKAFDNPQMTSLVGEFVMTWSPTSYNETVQVEYNSDEGLGNDGGTQRFIKGLPKQQTFNFIVDATLVDQNPVSVKTIVNQFLSYTRKMDGGTHRPLYLILSWDGNTFKCVLSKADINYSMLTREGMPLRAKITATFIEHRDPSLQNSQSGKTSADLTHVRTVTYGDNLPLLANSIYGDPTYYLELARINKLKNFRKLKAGDNLIFPPTE